ncbi:MAG: hypothetical protein KGY46_05120 [Anaerolineales bacterium]|nr:hypothetical protein [Anaerolineales bacterium]
MQEVKPGIYYENTYPGSTLGAILLPRGMLFIDTPLRPEDAHTWKTTLLNRSSGTIHKMLVCLDDHPDRTIGANGLECSILAHKEATDTLKEYSTIFRGQLPESGSIWEKYPETTGLQWVVPDICYNQQIKFHWGEPTVIVEHHPGPRPGASWVLIPDQKVAFIGDAAVVKGPPFLGKANIETWIETLDHLLSSEFKDYTLISGRGGEISQAKIKDQRKTLRKIHKRVEKLASREASPDDVAELATNFLDDFKTLKEDREFYKQRLKHGLYQYYMNNYFHNPEEKK